MYICNRLRCNLFVLIWAKVKIYLKDTRRGELCGLFWCWCNSQALGKDHGNNHFCCPSSLPTVWFVFGASRRTISPLLLGSQSQGPMGRWSWKQASPTCGANLLEHSRVRLRTSWPCFTHRPGPASTVLAILAFRCTKGISQEWLYLPEAPETRRNQPVIIPASVCMGIHLYLSVYFIFN